MLEYIPYIYNYQTYEPFLVNRNQVVYVPFLRQVYYQSFVPYYYSYPSYDVFSSYTENHYEMPSNSSSEISLDEVTFENVEYQEEINSETSYDETSVLSWSSSDSSNSYDHSLCSSPQESFESCSQGFVYSEREDDFDFQCDEDYKIAWEHREDFDEDRGIEADISSLSSSNDRETFDDKCPSESDCPVQLLGCISSHGDRNTESGTSSTYSIVNDEKSSGYDVKDPKIVEASSSKNIEKDRSGSNLSPESSNSESCVSSQSLLDYDEKFQEQNSLGLSELPVIQNEKIKRRGSHSSAEMPVWSEEMPLPKPEYLHNVDAKVPRPFDNASENENDSDCSSTITLQDILISEEHWKSKAEAYFNKKRNEELYRSALEGDIRPRKSLPDVGTLPTIFEDLPYPVNQPYDDGNDSTIDEFFELPPLQVKKSESSTIALQPKKKRFRNTRKFFSGMFRCFRPKTDVQDGQPP